MAATNAAFVAALQAMTVTGVTRHYDEPPGALSTADLPAAFPMMPQAQLGQTVLSCLANNKTRGMQYAIALEAAGQGTISQNYALIAAMMDNLETALDGLATHSGGTLALWIDYNIATGTVVDIAGTEYWGVVAEIVARNV